LFVNNTYLPLEEIKKLKNLENPRDAKMRLAFEITKIFHGNDAAKKAEQHFIKVFSKKELPEKIPELRIKSKELRIMDLLLKASISSKSEARRLILQKAVEINGAIKTDPNEILNLRGGEVLKIGKKKFFKIV